MCIISYTVLALQCFALSPFFLRYLGLSLWLWLAEGDMQDLPYTSFGREQIFTLSHTLVFIKIELLPGYNMNPKTF